PLCPHTFPTRPSSDLNPDHDSIRAAQGHDLPLFFRHELAFRRAGAYPPYRHLARLVVSGPHLEAVREVALRACREGAREVAGLRSEEHTSELQSRENL